MIIASGCVTASGFCINLSNSVSGFSPIYFLAAVLLLLFSLCLVLFSSRRFFNEKLRRLSIQISDTKKVSKNHYVHTLDAAKREVTLEYPLWITSIFFYLTIGVYLMLHNDTWSYSLGGVMLAITFICIFTWLLTGAFDLIYMIHENDRGNTNITQ
jgi:hypothetical protein